MTPSLSPDGPGKKTEGGLPGRCIVFFLAVMTKSEVFALLRKNGNARGIGNWEKLGSATGGLKSFGIGLTQLRKLAKQVGRDHALALELWETDNHDARLVGLLIDEPKKLTREQAEAQVEEVDAGMLAHVFSSCDATLPKAEFAFDLARDWLDSDDDMRRRCACGLVYELSKNTRKKELTEAFFLDCVARIGGTITAEIPTVRMAMALALIGIGKRTRDLNRAAVALAEAIGPVDYNDEDSKCEPIDVLKHLTSDYLKAKLGI